MRVKVSLGSIGHRAPVLDRLTIERASVHIVRLEAQRSNLSDIVERLLARPASDGSARSALRNNEFDAAQTPPMLRASGLGVRARCAPKARP